MPEQFGKYLLLDRINQGGMAEVYLAKVFGFGGADQVLALKRIRREVSEDPSFVEMFVNEAKLSVLLNHANIAQTFELGRAASNYYIAMEYVPSRDLRAVLDRANNDGLQLPEHLILHIVAQVLEGLDFAHRATDPSGRALEIVHRDVSPHNVLIGYSGEVKVIDFGIAKFGQQVGAPESQSGVLKGKYGYMAPEQVLGRTVDARTDIFSAGVLLYELLTQQRLFEGASDFSILEKVRYAEVYPPSTIAPRIPASLEQVVLRALAQVPEERYQSASDMHDAVVQAMLEHYSHPSPRELQNLMRGLFGAEIAADQKLLERSRTLGVDNLNVDDTEEDIPVQSTLVGRPRPNAPARQTTQTSRPDAAPDRPPDHDTDPGRPSAVLAKEAQANGASRPQAEAEEEFSPREQTQPDIIASRLPPETERIERRARPGRILPVDEATRARLEARVSPTEIRSVPGKARRVGRDQLIIAAALLVAFGLIVATWLATRGIGANAWGQVMILSVPPGATVILDGVVVGRTPYDGAKVTSGKHSMRLELPGFANETRVIEVRPKQMLPVQLMLRPLDKTADRTD